MATHSSILAWRIPGTEEPGGLPSMELHRVGHDWHNLAAAVAADNFISIPSLYLSSINSQISTFQIWLFADLQTCTFSFVLRFFFFFNFLDLLFWNMNSICPLYIHTSLYPLLGIKDSVSIQSRVNKQPSKSYSTNSELLFLIPLEPLLFIITTRLFRFSSFLKDY